MTAHSRVSRRQLEFYKFALTDDGKWSLVVLKFYAGLFSIEEPDIMKKSNTGWRESKNPALKFAFFKNLKQTEIDRIESFVTNYSDWVILDVNEHIKDEFDKELDFCVALGRPAETPQELNNKNRSKIGELVYLAKYKRQIDKADELAVLLGSAINRIIKGKIDGRFSISFVPNDNYEEFYLPKYLAEKLVSLKTITHNLDDATPFIQARIDTKINKLKNISLKAKLHFCKELYTPNKVTLATFVSNRNIVVIDDLYQSGTTLWSYARYLKNMGAIKVIGLVCEKNFRDSDNL